MAAGVGALIGGGAGALNYVLSHPGGSPGDYLSSGCFWRSVGMSAAAGAVAGLVGWGVAGFLPMLGVAGGTLDATLLTGFVTGAFAGGSYEAAWQLFSTGGIYDPEAVLGAGAVGGLGGAVFAGVWSGVGKAAQALAAWRVQRLADTANRALDQDVIPPGPYARPSGATTPAQRASVQGRPCVECGKIAETQVADHINPLVQEWYATGRIDLQQMRSLGAIQPMCPSCSAQQGGRLSWYSRQMRELFGFR